jgi:hypothetical protein
MRQFFRGVHFTDSVDSATEEQIVVNFARVAVIKYASMLSESFRISVAEEAKEDLRRSAQRRETFLLSMLPAVYKAFRKAELNACKLGFGVLQACFVKHASHPFVRELQIAGDIKHIVHEYNFEPGQERSCFHFNSVDPCTFFPVFTDYDDPNDSLLYAIRLEEGRLISEIRARYAKSLVESGPNWDEVEPTAEVLHYYDREDYMLVAKGQMKPTRNRNGQEVPGAPFYLTLEKGKHKWGRVPFWIVQNLALDDADPTYLGTVSDMDAIKELNRRFNEMLSEQATEVRSKIHPPLVYASDDHQQLDDITFEPNAVIPIGAEEQLAPLASDTANAGAMDLLERYKEAIFNQAFLNEASFGNIGSGVTGVGVRLAQASMEQLIKLKVPLRVDALTNLFGSVLFYAAQLLAPVQESRGRLTFRQSLSDTTFNIVDLTADDFNGDYTVEVKFPAVLPYDRIQHEQNEVYKFKAGVQPLRATLRNMGIQDVDATVKELMAEFADPVLNPDRVLATAQAKQSGGSQSPVQMSPERAPLPAAPRSMAPTVPSTASTPNGVNVPAMDRGLESAGPNFGADLGFPPGPGINTGEGGM